MATVENPEVLNNVVRAMAAINAAEHDALASDGLPDEVRQIIGDAGDAVRQAEQALSNWLMANDG